MLLLRTLLGYCLVPVVSRRCICLGVSLVYYYISNSTPVVAELVDLRLLLLYTFANEAPAQMLCVCNLVYMHY